MRSGCEPSDSAVDHFVAAQMAPEPTTIWSGGQQCEGEITMDMAQGTSGNRFTPAILMDLSGCDKAFALQDNCDAMIVPMAPTSITDLPGRDLVEALPGSVVFVPAGITDAILFSKSFDTLLLLVRKGEPASVRSNRWLADQALPEEIVLVTSPQSIGAIAQIARRIGSVGSGFSPECIDAVAQLLLSEIMLQMRSKATSVGKSRRSLDGVGIRAIDLYLDEHLEDPLSLDDLADQAELTRHQFSRRFKNATGVSPFQYVIAKRVKRARDLLARGKVSIAEVAYATGFSSQSHLTETFKRHFGVTPGAYKRAHSRDLRTS